MNPDLPHVGCHVLYYAYGTPNGEFPTGVPRAAIVTEAARGTDAVCGLCVLNPTGLFFNQNVPYGPGRPGHWGWGSEASATIPSALETWGRHTPPGLAYQGWIDILRTVVNEITALAPSSTFAEAGEELHSACKHIEDGLRRLQFLKASGLN